MPSNKTTFLDALRSGRTTAGEIDDWIEAWHDFDLQGRKGPELHEFLGMTFEQYARLVADPNAIDAIAAEAPSPDRDFDIFKISYGIPAHHQESSFMNSTLSGAKDGLSISVAVSPPEGIDLSDPSITTTMLRAAFRRLTDMGWSVEIQIGPDEDALTSNDPSLIQGALLGFVEAAN